MRVRALGPSDAGSLRQRLLEAVDTNLFLLGTLDLWGLHRRSGSGWWGAFSGRRLQAVAWCGRGERQDAKPAGLAVPYGGPEGAEALGRVLAGEAPPAMVIGPRVASDALWRGLGDPTPRTWFDQRLYVCTAPARADAPRLRLRQATEADLDAVAEASAEMMVEDLGLDPRVEDPDTHVARVRARVRAGRVLLGLPPEDLRPDADMPFAFKVDVGSRYGTGTQVGGTWVPPAFRGRGLAAAGMRATCDLLRRRHADMRVSLHVNEANAAAVRTYERAGFHPTAPFRLAAR